MPDKAGRDKAGRFTLAGPDITLAFADSADSFATTIAWPD